MQELTLAIAGIDFPNADGGNRRSEAMMTLPGDPVTLMPEPRNRHDRNAVAIISPSGMKLGYVSAERAPYIGSRINRGEQVAAIFQGIHGGGAYIRVRFGGGLPTLPPAAAPSHRSTRDEADGFYPDEDGPAWGA
ncbi:HIRAN domain-containing protein [Sphingomonas mollis]|uniref:HIRAN domain-containing protein n=1 Tax=Sphingomonas mollis TaxID=2795726 RepID=A0ABS0XTM4_9SPHN|nr:HIRAN domain-containing protein [Sphingomonas sp. BT553]MBJ6123379.1 hypothetical protein [Sphingomonas sp. BT553]